MKRTSIQSPYFVAYYHRLMKRKNGFKKAVRRDLDIVSRLGTNGYLYNHLAMDFADSKRYYHFVIQDSLKKKLRVKMNKGRRYRFMYNEILAKRRVFKDFQIKRVFEDRELNHRNM